jgi:hypothetical protein
MYECEIASYLPRTDACHRRDNILTSALEGPLCVRMAFHSQCLSQRSLILSSKHASCVLRSVGVKFQFLCTCLHQLLSTALVRFTIQSHRLFKLALGVVRDDDGTVTWHQVPSNPGCDTPHKCPLYSLTNVQFNLI